MSKLLNKLPFIRMATTDYQDIEIITTDFGADVIATKAECLTRLRNRYRLVQTP